MPSVDPTRSSMYPTSPSMSGGPPNVDSPERSGGHPPPHGGPYSYAPSTYGPPPPGSMPPYHPMASSSDKSVPPLYGQGQPMGQYPPVAQQYPGYGSGYMPAPYAYGRPWMYEGGGAPPPQGYGGGYPSQHSMRGQPPPPPTTIKDQQQRGGRSSRGGGHGPYPMPPQQQQQPPPQRQHHPASKGKDEDTPRDSVSQQPLATSSSTSPGDTQRPQSPHDEAEELERVKAAAAAELGLAEVKPIQSDFHFFVQDMKEKLREAATEEVDKSLIGKNQELVMKHRKYLINSNLNCRLLKAWEDLARDEREQYFKKEEDDRQRFMEDDEVASRHCFTLTARIRSPNKKSPLSPLEEGALDSPLKEATTDTKEEDETKEGDALSDAEELDEEDKQGKRSFDGVPVNDESPSKKNKADDEDDNDESSPV